MLTFGGKYEHREAETIDAEEFIAKKGLTAKGKKCSPMDLSSVEFGEPLVKPEDLEEPEAPTVVEGLEEDEAIDVDLDPQADENPVQPIEQTGQAHELLSGAAEENPADGAVDLGDWEPTLF